MWNFGPVPDFMTKCGQHDRLAILPEEQLPNCMALPTSWSKASTAVSGMGISWPANTARMKLIPCWPLRLRRASRWSKLWCALNPSESFQFFLGNDFDFWPHQMLLSKRTIQVRVDSTSSFPAGWIANPSRFCCNQLRRASSPMATCGDPHRATGALHGTLCPDWATWPFSSWTRSLVPQQCGRGDDLSERAF